MRRLAQKRGGGNERGESVFTGGADSEKNVGIGQVLGNEPTPEFAAVMTETCEQLLAQLQDETLVTIALHKMQGLTNEEIAKDLVIQTAKGAALLAAEADKNGESPAQLREKVTSPGGTTEAALKVFAEGEFGPLVSAAVKRARDRSRELSG